MTNYVGIKCSFCIFRNNCNIEDIKEISKCQRYGANLHPSSLIDEIKTRLSEETNSMEFEFRQITGDGIYLNEE